MSVVLVLEYEKTNIYVFGREIFVHSSNRGIKLFSDWSSIIESKISQKSNLIISFDFFHKDTIRRLFEFLKISIQRSGFIKSHASY